LFLRLRRFGFAQDVIKDATTCLRLIRVIYPFKRIWVWTFRFLLRRVLRVETFRELFRLVELCYIFTENVTEERLIQICRVRRRLQQRNNLDESWTEKVSLLDPRFHSIALSVHYALYDLQEWIFRVFKRFFLLRAFLDDFLIECELRMKLLQTHFPGWRRLKHISARKLGWALSKDHIYLLLHQSFFRRVCDNSGLWLKWLSTRKREMEIFL
jgi:hypothetical protein